MFFFLITESDPDHYCGRLRSYRYLRAHWARCLGVQLHGDGAAALERHAGQSTATNCTVAHFAGDAGEVKEEETRRGTDEGVLKKPTTYSTISTTADDDDDVNDDDDRKTVLVLLPDQTHTTSPIPTTLYVGYSVTTLMMVMKMMMMNN